MYDTLQIRRSIAIRPGIINCNTMGCNKGVFGGLIDDQIHTKKEVQICQTLTK